jgi:hypothetical protein
MFKIPPNQFHGFVDWPGVSGLCGEALIGKPDVDWLIRSVWVDGLKPVSVVVRNLNVKDATSSAHGHAVFVADVSVLAQPE